MVLVLLQLLLCNLLRIRLQMYNNIRLQMKPTPKKSHYTFNLRDVSKVFQGILMIQPKECLNADSACRLWAHETMRVFHDRLISDTGASAHCIARTRSQGCSPFVYVAYGAMATSSSTLHFACCVIAGAAVLLYCCAVQTSFGSPSPLWTCLGAT